MLLHAGGEHRPTHTSHHDIDGVCPSRQVLGMVGLVIGVASGALPLEYVDLALSGAAGVGVVRAPAPNLVLTACLYRDGAFAPPTLSLLADAAITAGDGGDDAHHSDATDDAVANATRTEPEAESATQQGDSETTVSGRLEPGDREVQPAAAAASTSQSAPAPAPAPAGSLSVSQGALYALRSRLWSEMAQPHRYAEQVD